MPFTHISLPSMASWPSKTKSSPARSRQTSVDLTKVSEDFGVPQVDDPDPFGVLALQRAGLLIKEAGTKSRPTSDTFEFRPSPSSPVFRHSSTFSEGANRLSRRGSRRSVGSNDAGTQTADLSRPEPQPIDNAAYLSPTQVASATIPSPVFERTQAEAWHVNTSNRNSRDGSTSPASPHGGVKRLSPLRQSLTPEPEGKSAELALEEASKAAAAKAATEAERKRLRSMSASQRLAESLDKLERSLPNSASASPSGSASPEDSDAEVIVEQVVTAPVQTVRVMTPKAVASPTAVRAKLVTIKGKAAPAIPARNPRRYRTRTVQAENGGDHLSIDLQDESSSAYSLSPTRSAFDRNDDRASIPWSEQTSIPDMDRASAKSLRATPELSESVDVSVGPDGGDKEAAFPERASERPSVVNGASVPTNKSSVTGKAKHSTPLYGLGIDGMSEASGTEARTDVTSVPSAAAHTSPTRLAHLEVPESQAPSAGDETPTAPQPTDALDETPSEIAQPKNNSAPDTVSISDTQSHYADDEADEAFAKSTGAKNSNAEDEDSDAFHSIPATPMRNTSPLHLETGPSPLKTTTTSSSTTVA